MTFEISPNTEAILLLTAPLNTRRAKQEMQPLTHAEYRRLAKHLVDQQREPKDLLSSDAPVLLESCNAIVSANRLSRLLERGFQLSQAVDHWRQRSIWTLSRADAAYPKRLKARLRDDAPAIVYGCGDHQLLEAGGLAVVGSRKVDDALIEYTQQIGEWVAKTGHNVVSGGAAGVDLAAMTGALTVGGTAVGVLADSLEKKVLAKDAREYLKAGQLVLLSPYDPSAGFNVGNAMQRNKLIYGLADAALVVNSDLKKGGTWTGAVEQLTNLRMVPVYVRSTGAANPGLDQLQSMGALPLPELDDSVTWDRLLGAATPATPPNQSTSLLFPDENGQPVQLGGAALASSYSKKTDPPLSSDSAVGESSVAGGLNEARNPSDVLFNTVRALIVDILRTPKKDADIAAALNVSGGQVKAWLKRLVEEQVIVRKKRGGLYELSPRDLFHTKVD